MCAKSHFVKSYHFTRTTGEPRPGKLKRLKRNSVFESPAAYGGEVKG